jgi:two-component system, chemotaxis family, protein-glutamate methylesterase/glutaminase
MTTTENRISVLVVEDTATVRLLLVDALESDPRLRVAAAVPSGEEALQFLAREKPSVILMDIHLPGISGFEATRRVMQTQPVPIVICSAVEDPNDVATTFEAMEAGALSVIAKPVGPGSEFYEPMMKHLVETVKLMSEVKVVRRWQRSAATLPLPRPEVRADSQNPRPAGRAQIVALGASTGGPPVLRTILGDLPADFPAPIAIVQHITPGFLQGLVEWLAQTSDLPIHIARHGERPLPGHVYFAPDWFHLGVGPQGHLVLSDRIPADVLCPSVGHLFQSIADVHGAQAVAVLLTGMGKDGARELALLKQRGATTIAQDRSTSVVHGMPGEAIRLDGAKYVLPAGDVAGALKRLLFQP